MSDKKMPTGTDSWRVCTKPLSLSDRHEQTTNIVSYGVNRLKRLMVFIHANDTYIYEGQSNNCSRRLRSNVKLIVIAQNRP